jgi:hypothetical protein
MYCRNKWVSAIVIAWLTIGFMGTADAEQSTAQFLDKIIAKVEAAKTKYENTRQIYENVKDDVEKARAGKLLADAEHAYASSMDDLDKARIQVLTDESGLAPEEISAMRAGGKGWGAIADDLGVHPGKLGRGHMAKAPRGPAASSDPGDGKAKGKGKKQKKNKY